LLLWACGTEAARVKGAKFLGRAAGNAIGPNKEKFLRRFFQKAATSLL
jgi:hypothetical protein